MFAAQQKSWIALLGGNTHLCSVAGHRIVRFIPALPGSNPRKDKGRFEVLWVFESNEQAVENFQEWLKQAASL